MYRYPISLPIFKNAQNVSVKFGEGSWLMYYKIVSVVFLGYYGDVSVRSYRTFSKVLLKFWNLKSKWLWKKCLLCGRNYSRKLSTFNRYWNWLMHMGMYVRVVRYMIDYCVVHWERGLLFSYGENLRGKRQGTGRSAWFEQNRLCQLHVTIWTYVLWRHKKIRDVSNRDLSK